MARASALRELIRLTDPTVSRASLETHPDDDMLAFSVTALGGEPLGKMAYYRAGLMIVDTALSIVRWRFGSADRVSSFLDFAAGYGRSSRFLAEHFGPERVCVGEIQSDALDFQARSFGFSTLQSCANPADLAVDRRHDVVFIASLFSHLPERTFGPWLAKVWEFVAPNGVLIFSVHDEAVNNMGVDLVDGFAFIPASEVAELSAADYGTNFTTEEFVRRKLAEALGADEAAQAIRLPQALCFHQDVWVVCKGAWPAAQLQYECGPAGAVDELALAPGAMTLRGWSADPGFCDGQLTSHAIRAVSIYRNGKRLAETLPSSPRPDIPKRFGRDHDPLILNAAWTVTNRTRNLRLDDVITVVSECDHGRRFVLDSSRVHDLLTRRGLPAEIPPRSSVHRRMRTAKTVYRESGVLGVLRYAASKVSRAVGRVSVRENGRGTTT